MASGRLLVSSWKTRAAEVSCALAISRGIASLEDMAAVGQAEDQMRAYAAGSAHYFAGVGLAHETVW